MKPTHTLSKRVEHIIIKRWVKNEKGQGTAKP